MNQRVFIRNLLLVSGVYLLAVAVGIALKVCYPDKDAPVYGAFKDLIPFIIAIPAAWLGYCFQRRQNYLKDVRDLWVKMVAAVQDAIQYTYSTTPMQSDYGKTLRSLSVVTEELRGVFANVGEESGRVGLFPFESLKAIHATVSALEFGEKFTVQDAALARKDITERWKKLRMHYLTELERKEPGHVDSPYISI